MDVDSPAQHAAMVDKLGLPFPYLSDPDRSQLVGPLGVSDLKDPRNIAVPALILLDSDGVERWRFVSRDFADRLPEDEVVEAARSIGLTATTQAAPVVGPMEPGPNAMPFDKLGTYFRGAKFAAQAMGLRHGYLDESVKEDSKAYVAEMDRYIEAVTRLREHRTSSGPTHP